MSRCRMAVGFLTLAGLVCLAGAWSPAAAEVEFSYGGSLRLRQEYLRRVTDLGLAGHRNRNFLRLKACLWGRADFSPQAGVYLRLTTEPYYYLNHNDPALDGFESGELFIDNLYLDLREVGGLPLDLRIGRQDFLGTFGEGFLVMDGAPSFSSTAFYFNAARATWHFTPDNSLDLVYIRNQETDKYLPVINKKGQPLAAGDERGAIIYSRNRISPEVDLEPYFIYKKEHYEDWNTVKALGAYGAWRPAPWTFRAQYARQFGDDAAGNTIRAQGGYLFADRAFAEAPMPLVATGGFAYLSGNDLASDPRQEGWNPLFSRYPWMSDLYVFRMRGVWSNLQLFRAGVRGRFSPDTSFQLHYNYLRANEAEAPGPLLGTGRTRGHLPQATLMHRFSESVDGLLQAEYLVPGGFYADQAKDALFFRWQLQYRF